MKNVIAVDIGGTNSRFAHFELDDDGSLCYINGLHLKTGDAGSLDDLIEMARKEGSMPVGRFAGQRVGRSAGQRVSGAST